MKIQGLFQLRNFLLAAALVACGPPTGRGDVDMSVRGGIKPTASISSTSALRTASGAILRIDGNFNALSALVVYIDDQQVSLTAESNPSALFVQVPAALASTTVAREVLVTIEASDDLSYARAIIPPAESP